MNVVVAGWAGAGKTTVAGTLARVVAARGPDVLVVEDDPTSTLATMLGIERAVEVAPLPEDLLNRLRPPREDTEFELAKTPQALIDDYGTAAPAGVTLLKLAAVKHRDSADTESTYLTAQKVLTSVLQERDEVTVIDAVTGVEHLPREAIAAADVLLVVVDPHYKSLEVGRRTAEFAVERGFSDVRVVANKVRDAGQRTGIKEFCAENDLDLTAVVPFDEAVPQALRAGRAPIDDAPEAAAVRAIGTITEELLTVHAHSQGNDQADAADQ